MPTFSLTVPIVTPAVGTDMAIVLSPDVDNPVEGDLALVNGSLYLVSALADQVVQGITIRARFWLGEWAFDTTQGVPYRERVFVKAPSLATLQSIFRAIILDTPGVASLQQLTFATISPIRQLQVTFVAVLSNGEILRSAFKPFVIPNLRTTA